MFHTHFTISYCLPTFCTMLAAEVRIRTFVPFGAWFWISRCVGYKVRYFFYIRPRRSVRNYFGFLRIRRIAWLAVPVELASQSNYEWVAVSSMIANGLIYFQSTLMWNFSYVSRSDCISIHAWRALRRRKAPCNMGRKTFMRTWKRMWNTKVPSKSHTFLK